MFRMIIAAVAVLAVAGGAAFWAYDRGDDGAEARTQVYRWLDVTVEVPEGSGLWVERDFWEPGPTPEGARPAIIITKAYERRGVLAIDAETGVVLKDTFSGGAREAVDELLKTVAVSPLDPATAPWPYSGEPPKVPRMNTGSITYIPPNPAAGIRIILETADGGDAVRTSNVFLQLHNGRSAFWIDVATGAASYDAAILVPEDKEVFDRFLSAVEYVGGED